MAKSKDLIAATLATQQWIEPVETGLKNVVDAVYEGDSKRGKPIQNVLHGVWLGHPLHPVLTDVPVGAWSVALVLDLVEAIGGSKRYRAGADAALGIGIAGAAAAAVTGLTDWKDVERGPRRTGLVHAALNTMALGCYIASAVQRKRHRRSSALALGYAGFTITMGAAWLGGHLTYANRIGVERVPPQDPPDHFTPVLNAEALEELKPHCVTVGGYPIVLVRRNAQIFALTDTCTHAGGPLSEGTVEDGCIRCPWHGSLFSLQTGNVVEGPATYALQKFETRVREGKIEVRLAPEIGAGSII